MDLLYCNVESSAYKFLRPKGGNYLPKGSVAIRRSRDRAAFQGSILRNTPRSQIEISEPLHSHHHHYGAFVPTGETYAVGSAIMAGNAELNDALQELLKASDLETVTERQILIQLRAKFGNEVVREHKAFLKVGRGGRVGMGTGWSRVAGAHDGRQLVAQPKHPFW